MKTNVLASSAGWMAQAESDLAVAKHLLAAGKHYDWVCYCAQQAAEKAVKAVRLCLATPIEQIQDHRLDYLLGGLSQLKSDPALARVGVLSPYVENARYPQKADLGSSPKPPPCQWIEARHAKEALKIADGVVEYCKSVKPGFEELWG